MIWVEEYLRIVSFKYGRLLFLSLLGLLWVGLEVIGYNLYKLVFFRNNKWLGEW